MDNKTVMPDFDFNFSMENNEISKLFFEVLDGNISSMDKFLNNQQLLDQILSSICHQLSPDQIKKLDQSFDEILRALREKDFINHEMSEYLHNYLYPSAHSISVSANKPEGTTVYICFIFLIIIFIIYKKKRHRI
ncbi:MAG: hypothetical protein M0R05_03025 [Bacilli bacterium]|nr:hypothetical protein [Bacilli bacterium]MDD4076630.1 hypothetical protein [Bacilli bacterium]MDD4388109.1 hypothetical protein [Bacilli bacterium]